MVDDVQPPKGLTKSDVENAAYIFHRLFDLASRKEWARDMGNVPDYVKETVDEHCDLIDKANKRSKA